jgi:ADP-heptose:LPS heptosyltransferase
LFSTLLPELAGTEVPFVYEVDRRLLGAYERAFPAQRFVPQEEPPREVLQRASRVLLAGSLPRFFRTSVESFGRQPAKLLSALPGRVDYYRTQLAALGPGLKVALSWRSSRKVRSAPDKSAPLEQLAPLLELERTRFVDVQYGDTAAERGVAEVASGARLLRFDGVDFHNDLDEMLAILEACDLVITTSNATAHFAGALGMRTWLLYLADQAPFHYWAHGGSYRSLWYPSVEIVTAPHLADWRSLAAHAAEKLRTVTGEQ